MYHTMPSWHMIHVTSQNCLFCRLHSDWLKKRPFIIQGSRKTGIPAYPLGNLLSHFAHPGHFLLVLGWVVWTLTHWASKVLKLPVWQDDPLVQDYRTDIFAGLVFWRNNNINNSNILTGNRVAVYIVLTGIDRIAFYPIANHLTACKASCLL